MAFFKAYFREHWRMLCFFVLLCALFSVCFSLYGLPLQAVWYPAALAAVCGAALLAPDYLRSLRLHRQWQRLLECCPQLPEQLPASFGVEGQDAAAVIRSLLASQQEYTRRSQRRYRDMVDYYTVWAHQIKTPIAAMELSLQQEDTDLSRRLRVELRRIEQYVDMVLVFLRMDSDSTDYVFRVCSLDDMLSRVLRRLSGEFIARRLQLEYTPTGLSVLTDEKWLSFVVEQVLSNALKYTKTGSIRIWAEGESLFICDTGIGIASEDLPRIFEKGYTGQTGRQEMKASGLGLYLCRQVCRCLGHTISAQSVPGCGTTIRIDLHRDQLTVE